MQDDDPTPKAKDSSRCLAGEATKMTTQHACLLFFRDIRRSTPLTQGRAWTPPSLSQRRGPQGCKRGGA